MKRGAAPITFPRACTRCGEVKEEGEFVVCRARPCGRTTHCRACDNARQRPKNARLALRYREDPAYRERVLAAASWARERRLYGGRKHPRRRLTEQHRRNIGAGVRRFWRRKRRRELPRSAGRGGA